MEEGNVRSRERERGSVRRSPYTGCMHIHSVTPNCRPFVSTIFCISLMCKSNMTAEWQANIPSSLET